jgi:FAD/FMN-containing dehydrogenase
MLTCFFEGAITEKNSGEGFTFAKDEKEAEQIWYSRKVSNKIVRFFWRLESLNGRLSSAERPLRRFGLRPGLKSFRHRRLYVFVPPKYSLVANSYLCRCSHVQVSDPRCRNSGQLFRFSSFLLLRSLSPRSLPALSPPLTKSTDTVTSHPLQVDVDEQNILAPIFGHAGDGNFHALLLFSTPEEQKKIDGLVHRMVERAQRLDGTCTGEHGVGMGKMVSFRSHRRSEKNGELKYVNFAAGLHRE